MRHGKPNPQNMRRRRYGAWLDSAAKLLKETEGVVTASFLMNQLPDNRHTPTSANSAAQKLIKDPRFISTFDYTTDLHGHRYKTRFFSYNWGYVDEE